MPRISIKQIAVPIDIDEEALFRTSQWLISSILGLTLCGVHI